MRILLAVYAFSAFLSSVICMDPLPPTPFIPSVVLVTRVGATESLFYDNGKLFWIDITPPELCCRHNAGGAIYCAKLGTLGRVYFAAPVENHPDVFVVGSPTKIYLIQWNTRTDVDRVPMNRLRLVAGRTAGHRINHGRVDPDGKLWFGTLNEHAGNYMLPMGNVQSMDEKKRLQKHIEDTNWSQGIVWDMLSRPQKCYFVDSMLLQVVSYTYQDGGLIDPELVINFPQHRIYGTPGNLAIDTSGNLWVPIFGGSQVVEVNPVTKSPHRIVEIGARKVIACTFGGPMLGTLFVATQGYRRENPNEQIALDDIWAGSIFIVRGLEVRGQPTNRYHLDPQFILFQN